MPETRTVEQTIYTYPELSETAKDAVRQRFSTWDWEDGSMQERMSDIVDGILEDAGFEKAENLSYQLYQQGGYPVFSTRSASPVFVEEPTPGTRRKRHTVIVSVQGYGGSSYGFVVEVLDKDGYEVLDEESTKAKQLIEGLSHRMYSAMVEEDEYMSSDEVVAESCEANEYRFFENGSMA